MVVEQLGDATLLLGLRFQGVQVLRHQIADTHHWLDLLRRDAIGIEDPQLGLQPVSYALRPFKRHPTSFLDHREFRSQLLLSKLV